MKKVTVKKQYKGYVSIKSTVIDECILNKEGLVITFNKKKMTIPLDKLNKHVQLSNQIYRVYEECYKLYDYFFVPDKKEKK
jgi:hypothetical protein